MMKRSRFSEEQITGILREQEVGAAMADVCRKHGKQCHFLQVEGQARRDGWAALDRGRQERRRENESLARQKWEMLELNRAPILISACLLRRTTEANGRVPTVDVQPLS